MNEQTFPINLFATSLIAPSCVIPKLFEKGVSKSSVKYGPKIIQSSWNRDNS